VTPDRGRGEPEPAAERGGGGRPELEDQPRDLTPGGGSARWPPGGGVSCSDVFHNIIVP
jgi:hypothetical protein